MGILKVARATVMRVVIRGTTVEVEGVAKKEEI